MGIFYPGSVFYGVPTFTTTSADMTATGITLTDADFEQAVATLEVGDDWIYGKAEKKKETLAEKKRRDKELYVNTRPKRIEERKGLSLDTKVTKKKIQYYPTAEEIHEAHTEMRDRLSDKPVEDGKVDEQKGEYQVLNRRAGTTWDFVMKGSLEEVSLVIARETNCIPYPMHMVGDIQEYHSCNTNMDYRIEKIR